VSPAGRVLPIPCRSTRVGTDIAEAEVHQSLLLGTFGGQRTKRTRTPAARLDTEDATVSPELRVLLDDRTRLAATRLGVDAARDHRAADVQAGAAPRQ
jgi:hypothetical protein